MPPKRAPRAPSTTTPKNTTTKDHVIDIPANLSPKKTEPQPVEPDSSVVIEIKQVPLPNTLPPLPPASTLSKARPKAASTKKASPPPKDQKVEEQPTHS